MTPLRPVLLLPVLVLALTTAAAGASLSLAPVQGDRSSPEAGVLTLDPTDGTRVPKAYRCAQTFPDLPLTGWTPITKRPVIVRRLLPGFQSAADHIISCEVSYMVGESTVVSTVEDMSRRTGVTQLPRSFLRPRPGVLFDLLTSDTTGYGAWPVVQYNDQGRSLMRFAYGNNFVPLEWSSDGYAWASEFTRGVDKGEPRRHTVILAHVYSRWMGADVMDWSAANTTLSVELSGQNLDLKGGRAYMAILVSPPDGLHARYHLRRPLAVADGVWSESRWPLRAVRGDWECSFVSNRRQCASLPGTPDLRYVEAVEVIITDGELPPTGVVKIRRLRVTQ